MQSYIEKRVHQDKCSVSILYNDVALFMLEILIHIELILTQWKQ